MGPRPYLRTGDSLPYRSRVRVGSRAALYQNAITARAVPTQNCQPWNLKVRGPGSRRSLSHVRPIGVVDVHLSVDEAFHWIIYRVLSYRLPA